MTTSARALSLPCLLLAGLAGCASAEPAAPADLTTPQPDAAPTSCPSCGTGMVCDQASATCVPVGEPTCTPACGPNAECSPAEACVCRQGYRDCNADPSDGCECQGECGSGGACGTSSSGCDPACSDDQVCDSTGTCVDKPPPAPDAAMALLQLRRLVQASEPKTLGDDGQGAQERVRFNDYEELPADSRQTFQTADAEPCTYEAGTTLYGSGWPSTPAVGAGDVTFTVDGAPGPIVVLAKSLTSGWAYIRDQPGGLKSGSTTNASWFSTDYMPYGAHFTVATAGGPDIGPLSYQGQVPDSFAISAPPAAEVGETPKGDLKITWSPAQAAAKMQILLVQTSGTSGYTKRLSCAVTDDGSTTIPDAVASKFPGKVFLQMQRTVERFDRADDAQSGREVHTTVVGMVEHHLWFQFQ